MTKWLSLGTAGHQSAPVGLKYLPSNFKLSKSILTRIDLGKMIKDPPPSFQTVWLNQKCWYLKNVQKDVECRRGVKGWLSGSVGLAYSWPSVSTWGSRMVAFKLQKHFDTHCLGKMIIDPPPSFQTVWLNQKCWYLKNAQKDVECRRGVKGWLSGSVWVTAGHQSAPGVLEWLPSSSPKAV